MSFQLPYLRPSQMDPVRLLVPNTPRILRPKDYAVIDGDTIWALAERDEDGQRPAGFHIRLRTIKAPEKNRTTNIEKAFVRMGIDSKYTSGDKAADFLKYQTKGSKPSEQNCLLIIPSLDPQTGNVRRDRFRRLIADVYISGRPGEIFEIANAKSVENLMVENGQATLNLSEKRAPHQALDAVRAFFGSPKAAISRRDIESPEP